MAVSFNKVVKRKLSSLFTRLVKIMNDFGVLAIAALLTGWLCALGFVCLANVLECAVAY